MVGVHSLISRDVPQTRCWPNITNDFQFGILYPFCYISRAESVLYSCELRIVLLCLVMKVEDRLAVFPASASVL